MDTKIDIEDIISVIYDFPDMKNNPLYNGKCVYTDPDGNHCIAGEILSVLGFQLPDYDNSYNFVGVVELLRHLDIEYRFTDDAILALSDAQDTADSDSKFGDSYAWKNAKQRIITYRGI